MAGHLLGAAHAERRRQVKHSKAFWTRHHFNRYLVNDQAGRTRGAREPGRGMGARVTVLVTRRPPPPPEPCDSSLRRQLACAVTKPNSSHVGFRYSQVRAQIPIVNVAMSVSH